MITVRDSIRVAVATKGGGIVNEHFGHAKEFQIYEVDETQATFLESRQVIPYCKGGYGEQSAMDDILQKLSDCKAVLVLKIGTSAEDRLHTAGIEPVQVYDAIETAVFDYYQKWQQSEEAMV
ncbi:dinitrogenase iron-molybdenum cofactor [Hydrococcus rivularis NIES-593]|uniref:Dinitrogenase iron-molybdenum cofactor n=2 Tax=Hydrococcus TaxID=1616833 RepID=A0A1U7HNY3_9CYAN|nr:dinitrogenase iron-molybdenum cofactor [Hydrococcus rivularis NIES-593]